MSASTGPMNPIPARQALSGPPHETDPVKKLKTLAAAASVAIAATASLTASAGQTSVASQAMQCYTMYTLLMEDNPTDEYRNNVLSSQSMLMGTIYVMNAGSVLKPVSNDQFQQATLIAESALLTAAKTDPDTFVDKLVTCEGWREELLTYMALGMENVPQEASQEVAQQILQDIPAPRESYPLKGATREDLYQLVAETLARHSK